MPYEIRGEPGRAYNLLSSAALSTNAEFIAIPPRFFTEGMTDTVLGTVTIGVCDVSSGQALHTRFGVANGHLSVPSPGRDTGPMPVLESWVCNLRSLRCKWRREAGNGAPHLSGQEEGGEVDMHHSRLRFTLPGQLNMTITRQALVDLNDYLRGRRVHSLRAMARGLRCLRAACVRRTAFSGAACRVSAAAAGEDAAARPPLLLHAA